MRQLYEALGQSQTAAEQCQSPLRRNTTVAAARAAGGRQALEVMGISI